MERYCAWLRIIEEGGDLACGEWKENTNHEGPMDSMQRRAKDGRIHKTVKVKVGQPAHRFRHKYMEYGASKANLPLSLMPRRYASSESLPLWWATA